MSKENKENKVKNENNVEQKDSELQMKIDALTNENEQIIAENERLVAENDKLAKTVARLQSSADNSDKFRDQLVALKNDFDSYKRRMRNDASDNQEKGKAEVIEQIFPVLDNFALAKAHLDEENLKAFEMVEAQFVSVLTSFGVEKMKVLGEEFDANVMNALSTVEVGEEQKGKVVQVYRDGFTRNGKVLRYAEVIVGK